jgi:hypothetical protein
MNVPSRVLRLLALEVMLQERICSGEGHLSPWGPRWGAWQEDHLSGTYVWKKALETGTVGTHGGGRFRSPGTPRISWRRALETEQLSLWALCKGNLEGGSFTGDPEGYVEEGSGAEHLSIGASLGIWKGARIPGTVKGEWKRVLEMGLLSLWELCEGNLEWLPLCWWPRKIG